MIEFSVDKKALLPSLLALAGVVDKKQSLPVLSNILFHLQDGQLTLMATDLEIEMVANISCEVVVEGSITVPAKKLLDIVRSLVDDAKIRFTQQNNYVSLQSGRSRFRLITLAADDFPKADVSSDCNALQIDRKDLQHLLQSSYFAMSQQDVRVYLNGLLLEFALGSLTAVSTDGHRMALSKLDNPSIQQAQRIILPRKGVLEILRLLSSIEDERLMLSAGDSHFTIESSDYRFMTKLVESRYPAYNRVIPRTFSSYALMDRDDLKAALTRITILAHEKTKAIALAVHEDRVSLIANNQQQEEASEDVEASIDGATLKIGMNAAYILDALNHIPEGLMRLSMESADSSILLESLANENFQYVIMPMKL